MIRVPSALADLGAAPISDWQAATRCTKARGTDAFGPLYRSLTHTQVRILRLIDDAKYNPRSKAVGKVLLERAKAASQLAEWRAAGAPKKDERTWVNDTVGLLDAPTLWTDYSAHPAVVILSEQYQRDFANYLAFRRHAQGSLAWELMVAEINRLYDWRDAKGRAYTRISPKLVFDIVRASPDFQGLPDSDWKLYNSFMPLFIRDLAAAGKIPAGFITIGHSHFDRVPRILEESILEERAKVEGARAVAPVTIGQAATEAAFA
jgi:hypothetical protein